MNFCSGLVFVHFVLAEEHELKQVTKNYQNGMETMVCQKLKYPKVGTVPIQVLYLLLKCTPWRYYCLLIGADCVVIIACQFSVFVNQINHYFNL